MSITRVKRVDDEIVYDANGSAVYEAVPLDIVDMIDGEPLLVEGRLMTHQSDSISFGYRTNTQNTSLFGDVIMADYKLATPMFTTEIRFDDVIHITDYERTYSARIVKKVTTNMGSNLWITEIKN